MDSWSTGYSIQTRILKRRRKYSGRRTNTTKEEKRTIRELSHLLTSNNLESDKEKRISSVYEDSRIGKEKRSVVPQKTADCEIGEETKKDYSSISQRRKSRPFQDQRNLTIDDRNGILELNAKRCYKICPGISSLLERKRNPENGDRRPDEKTWKDMKSDIHWSHHKVTKDQRKEHYPGHSESIFRNDSPESDKQERKCWSDVTELLWDRMEVTWILERNPNGQKNDIHVKNIERKEKRKRSNPEKNHRLSSASKWSSEENKQGN